MPDLMPGYNLIRTHAPHGEKAKVLVIPGRASREPGIPGSITIISGFRIQRCSLGPE
jgi:hypothetical protein